MSLPGSTHSNSINLDSPTRLNRRLRATPPSFLLIITWPNRIRHSLWQEDILREREHTLPSVLSFDNLHPLTSRSDANRCCQPCWFSGLHILTYLKCSSIHTYEYINTLDVWDVARHSGLIISHLIEEKMEAKVETTRANNNNSYISLPTLLTDHSLSIIVITLIITQLNTN